MICLHNPPPPSPHRKNKKINKKYNYMNSGESIAHGILHDKEDTERVWTSISLKLWSGKRFWAHAQIPLALLFQFRRFFAHSEWITYNKLRKQTCFVYFSMGNSRGKRFRPPFLKNHEVENVSEDMAEFPVLRSFNFEGFDWFGNLREVLKPTKIFSPWEMMKKKVRPQLLKN